jgi:hypothetical protein
MLFCLSVPNWVSFLPHGFFSTYSTFFQVKLPKQFSSLSDPPTVCKERFAVASQALFQVSPNIVETLFAVLLSSVINLIKN